MIKTLKPVTIHLNYKYYSNLSKTEMLVKYRHKKRIQKKLLNKLGYPFFRYSRFDGRYQAYMWAEDKYKDLINWGLDNGR